MPAPAGSRERTAPAIAPSRFLEACAQRARFPRRSLESLRVPISAPASCRRKKLEVQRFPRDRRSVVPVRLIIASGHGQALKRTIVERAILGGRWLRLSLERPV